MQQQDANHIYGGSGMDVQNHLGEFENVSARLLGTLSNLRYGKDTITNYRRILKRVGTYMSQHGYSIYSEDIGSRFLEEQLNKRLLSASYSRSLRSVIRRLNDECYETQYIRRHTGGCENRLRNGVRFWRIICYSASKG